MRKLVQPEAHGETFHMWKSQELRAQAPWACWGCVDPGELECYTVGPIPAGSPTLLSSVERLQRGLGSHFEPLICEASSLVSGGR